MTGVLTKEKKSHLKTDTQGEGHVTPEGEIRVMQLQAKEGQGLAATTEARKNNNNEGRILPYRFRGTWAS